MTKSTTARASGAGMSRFTCSSQYENAASIPMAPWAKLKTPEVV